MKKNLRNLLVLSLGLITTIASAQWSAESRTRVDNPESGERMADQRITVSADWGAVHVSTDYSLNMQTGANADVEATIYEAYVTTDLMGFATLTAGKQDLSFGSGALISSNDWGMARYTNTGGDLALELGGFNINVGTLDGVSQSNNYMNLGGSFAGADVNILMINQGDESAHGYDLSYSMGDFSLAVSMNEDMNEATYNSYTVSYNVMDNLTASVSQTSNEGGFTMENTALSGGWANGNIGYLTDGDEDRALSLSYNLGDISLGYTMHNIDNEAAGTETDASSMTLGYQLNDNAHVGLARFAEGDDLELTWITLSIGL
ncbi:MAG: hypothetical protein CMP60_03560 [Flavobacteriales bacterium]|mgnify:CR=1 FL=1|nr:hypothetical protein [Flavobacteriales bacterium]|tara:strand:- start:1333 stop:2289 length:957 start_codon:yes stop_codon:yes gene_type:complete